MNFCPEEYSSVIEIMCPVPKQNPSKFQSSNRKKRKTIQTTKYDYCFVFYFLRLCVKWAEHNRCAKTIAGRLMISRKSNSVVTWNMNILMKRPKWKTNKLHEIIIIVPRRRSKTQKKVSFLPFNCIFALNLPMQMRTVCHYYYIVMYYCIMNASSG